MTSSGVTGTWQYISVDGEVRQYAQLAHHHVVVQAVVKQLLQSFSNVFGLPLLFFLSGSISFYLFPSPLFFVFFPAFSVVFLLSFQFFLSLDGSDTTAPWPFARCRFAVEPLRLVVSLGSLPVCLAASLWLVGFLCSAL